jgi:hypothetical protein
MAAVSLATLSAGSAHALAFSPSPSEIRSARRRREVRVLIGRARVAACLPFLVQRHITGLSVLGIASLDGEKSAAEVDGVPTQLKSLTATQSGVHGEQDGGCQVIAKVREQPALNSTAGLLELHLLIWLFVRTNWYNP